jgi:hypothetical protein
VSAGLRPAASVGGAMGEGSMLAVGCPIRAGYGDIAAEVSAVGGVVVGGSAGVDTGVGGVGALPDTAAASDTALAEGLVDIAVATVFALAEAGRTNTAPAAAVAVMIGHTDTLVARAAQRTGNALAVGAPMDGTGIVLAALAAVDRTGSLLAAAIALAIGCAGTRLVHWNTPLAPDCEASRAHTPPRGLTRQPPAAERPGR